MASNETGSNVEAGVTYFWSEILVNLINEKVYGQKNFGEIGISIVAIHHFDVSNLQKAFCFSYVQHCLSNL